MFPLITIILLIFILDYYGESICSSRLNSTSLSRVTSITSFTAALVISLMWNHPSFFAKSVMLSSADHALSPGVVVAYMLFVLGERSCDV